MRPLRPNPASPWIGLLILLATPACVGLTWERTLVHGPVPEEVVADLPLSGLSLTECLERLGAPTLVQEHRIHGLVAAWTWVQERAIGATVSVPVASYQNISFGYNHIRDQERGIVLWFDEDWVLEDWRSGYVHQLILAPPRPASLEDMQPGA